MSFWHKWLAVWAWAVIAFGAVLTLGGFEATQGIVAPLFVLMNPAATVPFDGSMRFAVGLMGAVSLGWGLTLRAAIGQALALGTEGRDLWRGILTSVVIWYAIDSSISVVTGFALNAVSNTVLLIGLLLPLWRSGLAGGGRAVRA